MSLSLSRDNGQCDRHFLCCPETGKGREREEDPDHTRRLHRQRDVRSLVYCTEMVGASYMLLCDALPTAPAQANVERNDPRVEVATRSGGLTSLFVRNVPNKPNLLAVSPLQFGRHSL